MDNCLIFGDRRLCDLPPYEAPLDEGFYGKPPIVLETEPRILGLYAGNKSI